MTTHYLDLSVVPDPETSAPQLLGALYGWLHLALVDQQIDTIGVSFPRYSLNPRGLGNVLRLHGTESVLRHLMAQDWLKGVRDHTRLTDIRPVPEAARHRVVSRKQFKTSAERLRRRRMRRKGETAEEAQAAIPASVERKPNLPYVQLKSHSTGQSFCLFVSLGPLREAAVEGSFNPYGLSGKTSIPWF
jgi:CRISPR-associated endonuclease Csy4